MQFLPTNAQITFSRDWKNGKRSSVGALTCPDSMPPPIAICHTLMSELRAAAVCEARRLLRTQDNKDTKLQDVYPGEAIMDNKR
ncbi:adipokinetic hormone/corazonin-related peptide-like isoform X2 [Macrosteles quadrilineatus]|nr:adipokinetic hormone/corazonin-related peptide-like isoform X2 [Macrosteles quadrilineatus]